MNTNKLLRMCLLMLLLLPTNVHSSTLAITCYIGQPASVTCDFNTNVTATQRDFGMTRYDSPNDDTGDDVLVCKWEETKHEYGCFVEDGYMFNGVITNNLTVQIPIASDKVAGFYMCFYYSSEGRAYPCELKVESMDSKKAANDSHTDPPSDEDHTSHTAWIAAVCVIVAIAIILGVLVGIRRRHQNKKGDGCEDPLLGQPPDTKKQIQELLRGFELPKKNLEASMKTSKKHSDLMNTLEREIKQGLDNITRSEEDNTTPFVGDASTQQDAALQIYRLYCPLLDQAGMSDLLVVDLGCTILKISFVRLREQAVVTTSESYTMKTGTGNQMFAFIAESIKNFVCDHRLTEKNTLHAAIIFPFPCHQTSLKKARLAKCTREISCEDIVNRDIQELLQSALQRIQTTCKVKIVAIVNDALSTLVSVAHKTPACKIGLTVGTGFNACFAEQWRRMGTNGTEETQPEGMVYNTELGALGDNGCLAKFRTDFDRELDNFSSRLGSQIFEKMVSWTYIGDIVRLALNKLRQEELILPSEEQSCTLFQQNSITSDRVAMIASDTESSYQKTRDILTELEVTQYTDEDLNAIRYVCGLVCERATYLTAAALATLINRLNQPGVMVVVDGELNKNLPRFGELLYSITNKLVKPELKDEFLLVSSAGCRNVGAALIAAASMRQN